jgi:type IV secretion system protein VirB11
MSAALSPLEQTRLGGKFADALGDELRAILADPLVSDVLINPDGQVFVERVGERMASVALTIGAARRASLVKTAVVLGGSPTETGAAILETRIPGCGWRFEGVLPPVVEAPALSIRKPARFVYPLEAYVAEGRLSTEGLAALRAAVETRANVLVVGGTGSGKTTFVNAMLREVAERTPEHRVLLLEDTPELQCACPNVVPMVSTQRESLLDLLRASMRLRPDRIVVGEVRGVEAVVLLNSWNTGHPGGFSTVHASGAKEGLVRLEQLCRQGGAGVPRSEIAAAVNLVVAIGRDHGFRRVREIVRVEGLADGGGYACVRVA